MALAHCILGNFLEVVCHFFHPDAYVHRKIYLGYMTTQMDYFKNQLYIYRLMYFYYPSKLSGFIF